MTDDSLNAEIDTLERRLAVHPWSQLYQVYDSIRAEARLRTLYAERRRRREQAEPSDAIRKA